MKLSLIKTAAVFISFTMSSVSYASLVLDDGTLCHNVVGRTKPFVLKLKAGTDIPNGVFECVKDAKIARAAVIGVGDIKDPTLTYFKVKEKQFQDKKFTGIYEISSFTGEIVTAAENVHEQINLHVTLADSNYQTIGGHLNNGTVGAIAAITIIPISD